MTIRPWITSDLCEDCFALSNYWSSESATNKLLVEWFLTRRHTLPIFLSNLRKRYYVKQCFHVCRLPPYLGFAHAAFPFLSSWHATQATNTVPSAFLPLLSLLLLFQYLIQSPDEFHCRWNLVDLVIVLLSLAGIIIESLGSTPLPTINPTVARSLRVLRIIRGELIAFP